MLKSLVGKVLAAKLLAAAASALAVGGVAYAATTGHLPDPIPHSGKALPAAASHMSRSLPASATPEHKARANSHRRAQATGRAHPTNHATGAAPTHPTHPDASPSPSLAGLCHAWLARPAHSGRSDQTPAAAALIAAAGGRDSVTSYCTTLLATTHPSRHSAGKPTKSHPTGKPTDAPNHPASAPHRHPTGKPSHHHATGH